MSEGKITVQVAADWVAALDAGLTPAQQRELDAWLAEDPSHRFAFNRLNGQYKALDRLSEFRPATEEIDADLPLRITVLPTREGERVPQSTPVFREDLDPVKVGGTPSMPVEASAKSGSCTKAEPEPPRTKAKWVLLPLPLAAAALLLLFTYTSWYRPAHGSFHQSATTSIGDLRVLVLPDASVITLNTDSAVDVVYTSSERRVQLTKGEAHFAVAKNKDRPFIVGVGNVSVRAVGTAFNIRLKPEQIEVVVTEGLVRVDDTAKGNTLLPSNVILPTAAEEPVLAAGERLTIPTTPVAPSSPTLVPSPLPPAPSALSALPPSELSARLSWREQRLVFDPTPLADVVAEFNRYNRKQLRIADDPTGRMLVGGTFKADDIETLVRLLESSFNVTAERHADVIVLRKSQ